jgi:PAS domain S-box-containing protein
LLTRQNFLLESEARYRLLIENQSDLVVHYSTDMEINYASPNYCELFGKSSEQIVGSCFAPDIHEEDRQIFDESQVELREYPFSSQYDRMREKIDGDWRWCAWSFSGVVDEYDELETVTAIGRDITELMRLELQISQAQKMQAVGQMADGISHDFNNLLQVMLAHVEFVLEDLPDDSPVNADFMRVRESIILNLCFNARDSIEENGSIWITMNRVNTDMLFRHVTQS